MKTITTVCLLSTCVFLSGVDSVEAQNRLSRHSRRVIISESTPLRSVQTVSPGVVRYGGFSHIDDLAVEMEQRARDVLWEMHFHYRQNRDFDTTYAEAYNMLLQAKALHQAEHRGDRAAISRVVTELDELFHHVEDDIRTWRPSHHHRAGQNGLSGKMEAMELTLHHLMEDVGIATATTGPPAPGRGSNPPVPRFRLP